MTLEKKRVLVVDDDKVLLKSFKEVLELEGYLVDTAMTGREAIEKSEANFYNLTLIDIRLADMEGTELLTRIRETTPKMVKIMITGYPSLESAKDSVNKGADGYLIKPVDMTELLNMIRDRLSKQEEARKYSEEKVKEYIETRAREQDSKG